ncbi:MAG: DUF4214 domain-containing protein [Pseudomonadota bacterium]
MGASIEIGQTRWLDAPEDLGRDPGDDPLPVLVAGGTILVPGLEPEMANGAGGGDAGLVTVSAARQLMVRDAATLGVEQTGRIASSATTGQPELTALTLGGTDYAFVTGTGGPARGQAMAADGALSTWLTLDLGPAPLALAATALPGNDDGDLIAASARDAAGVTLWQRAPDGSLTQRATLEAGRAHGGDIRDLAFIDTGAGGGGSGSGGGKVLAAISQQTGTLTTWVVDGQGAGAPRSFGAAEGLAIGLGSTLRTLEHGGRDYLLAGAAGTSSISLLEVAEDGSLTLLDQVNDTRMTRFQGVSVMETITVDGRGYVLAGGRDDGLTLLALQPALEGGLRFHKIAQIADTEAAALSDPTALGLRDNGDGTLTAFVASEESGLTALTLDLGAPGTTLTAGAGGSVGAGGSGGETLTGGAGDDVLLGGAGADRLFGGAGRDVIHDGAGEDSLTGGAGADTFVISQDGARDVIRDFELSLDRLDFSAYDMLYSINDFGVVSRADGGVGLRYNGETLVILPASGALSPDDITDAILTGLWHIDVNPFEDDPLYAVGDLSDDHLAGGLGDDQLFGSAGADRIEGGGGDDLLHGENEEGGYDSAAAQVARLYQATLDRAPDRAGHSGWTEALEEGAASLQEIADGFVLSTEFQTRYGGATEADFVTLLYENVLGRAPDAAGLAGWTALLDDGAMGRNEVVLGFSESPEFIALTQADALPFSRAGYRADWSDDVYRLYRATLDRAPDPGGFLGWTDQLSRQISYGEAVEGFIGSSEFQTRYGALDEAGFVTLLYDTVLDRSPAQAEVSAWLDLMEGGLSRAQVVEGFAQSPEFQALTAPDLAAYMGTLDAENDRLIAGAGEDLLFGGIGADTFVFDAFTEGTHEIADFEPWDRVEIMTGYGGPVSYDELSLIQVGGDALLVAGASTVIFADTDVTALTEDIFSFG